jgi:hypothetical protein
LVMARRGERDVGKERFWRKLMALWRRSQPMTVRDFCAEHGVSEPSFYGWRRTLAQRVPKVVSSSARRSRRQADEQAKFVPLRIVPPGGAPIGTGSADLQVVLGSGRIIRVPPGFDAATLRQLLVILEEERPC